MKIIDHGSWSRYVPKIRPEHLSENINVLFCKNKDGKDWYDYLQGNEFAPSSIKLTVMEGIVRAAVRDASRLFPQNCQVLEIIGDQVSDPQAKYGDRIYDAVAHSFKSQPPPPQVPDLLDTIKQLTARIEELERRK